MVKRLTLNKTSRHISLVVIGLIIIYPLLWLLSASFKGNEEIFTSAWIIPQKVVFGAFKNGWEGSGQITYTDFFINTFGFVIPTVAFTVISSAVVAYGFSRFRFFGKKVFFAIMLSTLLLPQTTLLIPRFIMFNRFGWTDSYKPFIIPALFATSPFFIFLLVQFFKGIPKELDESAFIDGCGSLRRFVNIILPLTKPALFSVAIFQFIWTWNDFLNVLIYINSVEKYPLSLGLRMTLDIEANVDWNEIMAMSVLSLIPPTFIFFFLQKYFIEGITTSGLKG